MPCTPRDAAQCVVRRPVFGRRPDTPLGHPEQALVPILQGQYTHINDPAQPRAAPTVLSSRTGLAPPLAGCSGLLGCSNLIATATNEHQPTLRTCYDVREVPIDRIRRMVFI